MEAGDVLNPVDKLVDEDLAAGEALLAPRAGPEGYDADLNEGTVKIFDESRAAGVSVTGPAAVAAGGAHHGLRDHGSVKITANLVVQDLYIDLMKSVGVSTTF